MFKPQTILVLDYKKKMIVKSSIQVLVIHASSIASDSGIDETIKVMHQSIMTKIKNYACEDCIVLDVIIKHSIKIVECSYKENK